ncbi:MAG: hypothetical protein ACE5DQ_02180, partial [Candidatus Paceibacterota bacterium]
MSQEARSSSDRTHSHRNITTTLKELRRNESFWKVAKLASAAGVSIAVVIMAKRLLNQGRHDELEHFLGQAGISGSLVEQLEHIEYINVPDIEKSVREYLKTHAYWATPARATPAIWQSTMELMQARWQEPLLSARHLKTERGFNPDSFRFPEGIFAILQYDQVQAYVSLV